MRFNPSQYSDGYGLHEMYVETGAYDGYGASIPGFDKQGLLRDLTKAEKGISQALPPMKKARMYIKKVKPKKGFGKTWRPRWKIWNAINKYVMPKLNSAIKQMTAAKADLKRTKEQIQSLPV